MKEGWRSFPRLEPWEWVVVIFALGNFVSFVFVSQWLGGTAANGMIDGAHYYLGEHGRYTEVSRNVFTYSQNHLRLMIMTHTLAACVLVFAKVRELGKDDTKE